jgi:rubrerythrin
LLVPGFQFPVGKTGRDGGRMGMLTEKQKRLLILFRQAIESERDAQKLYSDMLMHCEDSSIKRVLEDLIVEERRHEEHLIEKYNELRSTTEFKD